MKILPGLLLALAFALGACAESRGDIASEFVDPSLPASSTVPGSSTSVPSTTIPIVDTDEVVNDIVEAAETIRDLTVPSAWREASAAEVAAAQALPEVPGDGDASYSSSFLRMLGVVDTDIGRAPPGLAVYDRNAGEVLIRSDAELSPLARVEIFEAFVQAATDREFGWSDEVDRREREGDFDGAWAIVALAEGDGRFFSDAFVDRNFDTTESFALEFERIEADRVREELPPYVATTRDSVLSAGHDFVEDLISTGGVRTLNAAYVDLPGATEHIYHPSKYLEGEAPLAVVLPEIGLGGYEVADVGSFGEFGMRALLSGGPSSSQQLQAATGWGGDRYRTWFNGEDIVMLLMIEGDNAREAAELNEALSRWALTRLPVGAGLADNRGLAYSGNEAYAFMATEGSEVVFVVATDPDAGRFVRDYFWPTY